MNGMGSDCNSWRTTVPLTPFSSLSFQILGAAGPKFVAQTATPMRKNESQLLAWLAEPRSFKAEIWNRWWFP